VNWHEGGLGSGGHSGPNHDRWLISYADFITLLFAVFVVLFASAQSDRGAARRVSEAVVQALKSGAMASMRQRIAAAGLTSPSNPKDTAAAQAALAELMPSLKVLNDQLREEIRKGQIDVRLEPRGLVISLRQAAFFPSGEATVNPETYPILDKMAAVIQSVPNPLRMEGHTDAVPIHNSRFASNWELSAVRSINMLEVLVQRNKVDRSRVSVAGYADTMPVSSNDDADGRAHNRRVDVVILNQLVAAEGQPVSQPGHSK
jgi:chemotaxis protein MotB